MRRQMSGHMGTPMGLADTTIRRRVSGVYPQSIFSETKELGKPFPPPVLSAETKLLHNPSNFAIRLSQGGLLMKIRLAVLFVVASCLFSAGMPMGAKAADPGDRYSDAFVLIQQGQAAEEKSDLSTAYQKYHTALDILHAIRIDSPDWNTQMVEYRLKDCQAHFDAIKAKIPEPPAAPASVIVSPAVAASAEQPAPLPPAPIVKNVMNDESAKFRAQADKLQAENSQLKSDLAEARRAAKSSAQVDKLTHENKDLKDQLAAAEKKAADAKAAAAAESPELKKARAEADSARAEADKARKAASDLEKKNSDRK